MSLCTCTSTKLQVLFFYLKKFNFKFQDVLSESDKAMSVVKDLFGDDPKVIKNLCC